MSSSRSPGASSRSSNASTSGPCSASPARKVRSPARTSATRYGRSPERSDTSPIARPSRDTVDSTSSGRHTFETNDCSIVRVSSGEASAGASISLLIISAMGAKTASSSNRLARPRMTRRLSSRDARNSSTRRLLPMPGSPRTETRCRRDVSAARANVSDSRFSSRPRPTSGIVRRADRTDSASTAHAVTGSAKPFACKARGAEKRTDASVRRRVVSPTTISPGPAAACSRAARFTTGPDTRN
jgi:hypothetical protein